MMKAGSKHANGLTVLEKKLGSLIILIRISERNKSYKTKLFVRIIIKMGVRG